MALHDKSTREHQLQAVAMDQADSAALEIENSTEQEQTLQALNAEKVNLMCTEEWVEKQAYDVMHVVVKLTQSRYERTENLMMSDDCVEVLPVKEVKQLSLKVQFGRGC